MRRADWRNARNHRRGGFTLLELLVVVAILAIVGAGLLANYGGLTNKAAEAQAVHGIGAIDGALRTHNAVTATFPDNWDSLMETSAGDGTDGVPYRHLNPEALEHLGSWTLTADGVATLNAAGIARIRYVDTTLLDTEGVEYPARVFDDPNADGGRATTADANGDLQLGDLALASGQVVAAARTGDGTNAVIPAFDGSTDVNSEYLNEATGLPLGQAHLVIALGIGRNNTLISKQADGVKLAEAPIYQNIKPIEYPRFIGLFHLASARGDGTFDPGDYLEEAQLVGVVESKTEPLIDELTEFKEQ